MGRLRLFDRVKSWFGVKIEAGETAAGPVAKRWSLEPAGPGERLGFSGAGATAVASRMSQDERQSRAAVTAEGVPLAPSTEAASPSAGAVPAEMLDSLDPAWMKSLEELPGRIASAVGHGAAGLHTLKEIAGELEGHRQSTRAMLQALRRLPFLSAEQAEIARDTNKLLERQLLITESMFDGITSLRASFRSVEESSRRHVQALAQLETCHRNVLLEYQAMLVRAHRRLGWMAAIGVLLAATALGSAAYVAWRVLLP
jgi:hypothetical protein